MKVYDFEYDGVLLSDKGFIICKFDSSGVETVSNGSELTFNTVATLNGVRHELTSVQYEDCLTTTFQICKHPCVYDSDEEITLEEVRDMMRWLNRKGFHRFVLINDEYINTYFEASFNVSRIEVGGIIRGFEIEMFTNSPFAFQEPVELEIENPIIDGKVLILSKSDEEGYIYPKIDITVNLAGDLEIYNDLDNRTMLIKNCQKGEVIHMNYPVITSSIASHKIQNDFNWKFFRIARKYEDNANYLTISLPCKMNIVYSPVIKIGV